MGNNIKDITKTGPQDYRSLQEQNNYNNDYNSGEVDETMVNALTAMAGVQNSTSIERLAPTKVQSPLYTEKNQNGYRDFWGNSRYDRGDYANAEEFNDLRYIRANNQTNIERWGAGISKGVVLAGTTFVDGTVGLLYGVGDALAHIGKDDNGWKTLSRIWDNDVSNAMQAINKWSENYLPSYQRRIDENSSFIRQAITFNPNFWAEGVLKNLGFMVGAVYSGGVWNKGINLAAKGIKSLSTSAKTAKLAKQGLAESKALGDIFKEAKGLGGMGAKVVGATLSGVNEARIEANQNSNDWKELEYSKAADNLGITEEDLLNNPQYENILNAIDNAGAKVGAVDFWSNLPILIANDYALFGKLYARGYSNAKEVADNIARTGEKKLNWFQRMREAGKKGLQAEVQEASLIAREGGEYIAKIISNKDTWKKVLKTGLKEGNEEMAQQMAANFAGNLYETDGPDAYYNALNNPSARLRANNFLSSLTKAFAESYGDGDQWEQFAVGFISAQLGMPTFGRVNNSDANTVLGKGKIVGWSGGIIGEFQTAKKLNQEAQRNAEVMNKAVKRLESEKNHYALSNSFTDAMDGFSEDGDKFEYKNAEDNLDFATIQAFSNAGRLDELKEMVGQSFDNLTEEELGKIALFTTKNDAEGNPIGGWKTADGKPMATIDEDGKVTMSVENQAIMKKELENKRKKIINQIDNYSRSLEFIRAFGNNSLTDEQNQELAWLHWKGSSFRERFLELRGENEENLNIFSTKLKKYEEALLEERKHLTEDKNPKELKDNDNILHNVREIIKFIDNIQSAAGLGDIHKNGFDKFMSQESFFTFVDAFSDESGMDYLTYRKFIQDVVDINRLYDVNKTFNERLKEFINNPMSIISGRQNTEAKNEAKVNAATNIDNRDKVNNEKVSNLVKQAEEGEVDLDELESMYDSLNSEENSQDGKNKVKTAKDIIDTKNKTISELNKKLADGEITQQQYDDAIALLNTSTTNSENLDELTDLSSFSFNDTTVFDASDLDPSITPEDIESAMEERKAEAQSVLKEIFDILEQNKKDNEQIPETFNEEDSIGTLSTKETGHDSTTKIKSENERKQENKTKEETKKEAIKNGPKGLVDRLLEMVTQGMPTNIAEATRTYFLSDFTNIAQELYKLKLAGTSFNEALHAIQESKPMQHILQYYGESPAVLDNIVNIIADWWNNSSNTTEKENIGISEETTMAETDINDTSVEDATRKSVEAMNQAAVGSLGYWKTTTSEISFVNPKSNEPYWKEAERNGAPKEEVQRLKARYNYLLTHNAFNNAFNIKEEDKVDFVIEPELNKEAGEVVILLFVDGRIVGDLGSLKDANVRRQPGLVEFINKTTEEYNEWSKKNPDRQFMSSVITTVADKMIGVPPFTPVNERTTLNNIHTTTDSSGQQKFIPFKLGIKVTEDNKILMTPNRRKTSKLSKEEKTIISAINSKVGQPFLLMPTGNSFKAYYPVAISMPRYTEETANSKLGQEIEKSLNKLSALEKGKEVSLIRELQELLSIPELHIDVLDNGRIKISVKQANNISRAVIYEGHQNNKNLVSEIKVKLYNTPFQISRKYINTKFKDGSDYNSMIGEIATVNIEQGAIHLKNSWFTINPIINGEQQKATKQDKGKAFKPTSITKTSTKYTVTTAQGTRIISISNSTYTALVWDNKHKIWKSIGDTTQIKALKAQTYINNNYITTNNEDLAQTPWGVYNTKTGRFVNVETSNNQKIETTSNIKENINKKDTNNSSIGRLAENGEINPSVTESASQNNDEQEDTNISSTNIQTNNTNIDYDKEAQQKGLTKLPIQKRVWNALNNNQKEKILSLDVKNALKVISKLVANYNSATNTFKSNIEDIISSNANRKEDIVNKKTINIEKELRWLSKVLPNISSKDRVKIVDRLIALSNRENGPKAWGQFKRGIMIISRQASRGTVYHEAFHAVINTLLEPNEITALFEAAVKQYGELDVITLEEKLAEDFRRYVQLEKTPIVGKIVKIFRTLKHLIQTIRDKETYINNLFYRIQRGQLANKQPSLSEAVRNRLGSEYYKNALKSLNEQYERSKNLSVLKDNIYSAITIESAREYIRNLGFPDVLYPFYFYGRYRIRRISENTYKRKVDVLSRLMNVEYRREDLDYYGSYERDMRMSEEALMEQDNYEEQLQEHYREKYMYSNLDNESKEYLNQKGISIEEYLQLSNKEQEVLMHCK